MSNTKIRVGEKSIGQKLLGNMDCDSNDENDNIRTHTNILNTHSQPIIRYPREFVLKQPACLSERMFSNS